MPQSPCLHELVESQARRSPRAVAVTHRQAAISYQALDRRATRLAVRLRAAGVRPETAVGVRLEPSIELVVALLAVLKAGGAYVPIAPTTGHHRLDRIVADAPLHVMVASRPDALPELACPILAVDAGAPRDAPPPLPGIDDRVGPDNLAYVLYTSGSTGAPKGVMVPHRGICNTLAWRQGAYPFTPADRVLLTFSFVFDASIFELFQPLIGGACVVIPDTELGGDPELVIDAIRSHRITVLGAVPSTLERLAAHSGLSRCDSLRIVFSGGEALTRDLVDAVQAAVDVEVVNVYGPTEGSMEATASACIRGKPVVIGRPIANMRAYLLDDDLNPVPDDLVGQLYLAGVGLARGYCADPALTAARFVPNPFDGSVGARMYRTGDRCRRRPDGTLDYVGRDDQQVKIRGQRLELGEVEAALRRHEAVSESAVRLDHRGGEPELVAYIASAGAQQPTRHGLRRHLADWLPRYMIPSAFVFVNAMPRTATGKLDRARLSTARRQHGRRPRTRLPRSPLERSLAGLWTEVLGIRSVGLEDDFFELGGTSIHAATLARRLEEVLGEYVYSVAVYDAPTLGALAAYLRATYPLAVRRFAPGERTVSPGPADREVRNADLAELRRAVRRSSSRPAGPSSPKNRPAVFILSPPRCGSTLLRTMLGAHPGLFAPPELQLLNFETLGERRAVLASGRDDFWLQGTVRALMELCGCDAEAARSVMDDCEARDLSVKGFYRFMQDRLGKRVLIDKTPMYSLSSETLGRAERDFDEPMYVHLVRDPIAAIASFREVRLHVFFRPFLDSDYDLDSPKLAELIWTASQQNIVEFLAAVPAHRQHLVRFEELAKGPERILASVASFLGLPYDARMRDPYQQDQRALMNDPVHPLARMLGDVKLSRHAGVRGAVGERAMDERPASPLGRPTVELAERLGYPRNRRPPRALVALQARGSAPALFCVHPAGGGVSCYRALTAALGHRQPVCAFRATSLEGGPDAGSVEGLAAGYVAELRTAQPRGPYRLAGWSFGGIVTVEMARQLRAAGEEIGLLALISSHLRSPDRQGHAPRPRDLLVGLLCELGLEANDDAVSRLDLAMLLTYALERARDVGAVPPTLTIGEFRREVDRRGRLYRRHVEMARRYTPRGPIGDLLLIESAEPRGTARGPFVVWETIAASVTREVVTGDHYTMLRAPHVAAIAHRLRERLSPRGAVSA